MFVQVFGYKLQVECRVYVGGHHCTCPRGDDRRGITIGKSRGLLHTVCDGIGGSRGKRNGIAPSTPRACVYIRARPMTRPWTKPVYSKARERAPHFTTTTNNNPLFQACHGRPLSFEIHVVRSTGTSAGRTSTTSRDHTHPHLLYSTIFPTISPDPISTQARSRSTSAWSRFSGYTFSFKVRLHALALLTRTSDQLYTHGPCRRDQKWQEPYYESDLFSAECVFQSLIQSIRLRVLMDLQLNRVLSCWNEQSFSKVLLTVHQSSLNCSPKFYQLFSKVLLTVL